jgi:hypothetical protein
MKRVCSYSEARSVIVAPFLPTELSLLVDEYVWAASRAYETFIEILHKEGYYCAHGTRTKEQHIEHIKEYNKGQTKEQIEEYFQLAFTLNANTSFVHIAWMTKSYTGKRGFVSLNRLRLAFEQQDLYITEIAESEDVRFDLLCILMQNLENL